MGLLGIESAHEADGRDISGTLLGTDGWSGHPYAFSETFYGRSNKATVISETHQLIRSIRKKKTPSVVERLHEKTDPLAKNDLIGTGLEVEAELQARLDQWLMLMKQWERASLSNRDRA